MVGFRNALTKTFNDYARSQKFLKDNEQNLSGEDIREGLTAIISVKISEPQFEGQTKTKLGNSEMRGIVENMVKEKLTEGVMRPLVSRDEKTIKKVLPKIIKVVRFKQYFFIR